MAEEEEGLGGTKNKKNKLKNKYTIKSSNTNIYWGYKKHKHHCWHLLKINGIHNIITFCIVCVLQKTAFFVTLSRPYAYLEYGFTSVSDITLA